MEFFKEDSSNICGGSMVRVHSSAAEINSRGENEASTCMDFCEERGIPKDQRFRVLSKLRLLNRICSHEGRRELVIMRLSAFIAMIQGNMEHGTIATTTCVLDTRYPFCVVSNTLRWLAQS